jgi:hypothetical protein
MPRKSTIKLLPSPIRDLINQLLADGVTTLDQILEKLREIGVENVKRSTLGRYAFDMNKIGERMRRSRDVANALVDKLGEGPENRAAQLNLELMHSVVFDLLAGGEDGAGVTFDAEQAMFISRALKDLSSAQKTQAEFVLKIRQETAKALKAEAVKEVDSIAAQQGLTAATVNAIKAKILGVKLPPPNA